MLRESVSSADYSPITESCPQVAQIFADQMVRYYVHNSNCKWV